MTITLFFSMERLKLQFKRFTFNVLVALIVELSSCVNPSTSTGPYIINPNDILSYASPHASKEENILKEIIDYQSNIESIRRKIGGNLQQVYNALQLASLTSSEQWLIEESQKLFDHFYEKLRISLHKGVKYAEAKEMDVNLRKALPHFDSLYRSCDSCAAAIRSQLESLRGKVSNAVYTDVNKLKATQQCILQIDSHFVRINMCREWTYLNEVYHNFSRDKTHSFPNKSFDIFGEEA